MEDKILYMSELALGILAKSQKHDVYVPESDVYINAEITDLHKELFSLTSKGFLKISEESGLFEICDDFVPVLKNIFNAKLLVTVNDCSLNNNHMYYISTSGITELSCNGNRKKYGLMVLDNSELASCIQGFLRLPEPYNNGQSETELFIDLIEKNLERDEPSFSPEYLNMNVDEITSSVDGVTSVIDFFSCKMGKVVSKIIIYRCSVYYKIVEVTSNRVNILTYNFTDFEDMIGERVGEFYDNN